MALAGKGPALALMTNKPPAPTPAPAASAPAAPMTLAQQFGVMPDSSGLFIPGAEAAFKGPLAGQMMKREMIRHAADPQMPEWLKDYGKGSFLDKLPGKKSRVTRAALADAVDRRPAEEDDFGIGAP